MTDAIRGEMGRLVLGLLFVVAFGWMAALVLAGPGDAEAAAQQMAAAVTPAG